VLNQAGKGLEIGPTGAVPHFAAQRPDHSPPDTLSDDELARAIDSLERKLRSAKRMLTLANSARLLFFGVLLVGGFAILIVGPAPFLELAEGQRTLATTWDVFAWWFAVLAIASVAGALAIQAARRRRRRAAGWRNRVEDLDRRLTEALQEQASRRAK
jgi:hypothetical protein